MNIQVTFQGYAEEIAAKEAQIQRNRQVETKLDSFIKYLELELYNGEIPEYMKNLPTLNDKHRYAQYLANEFAKAKQKVIQCRIN